MTARLLVLALTLGLLGVAPAGAGESGMQDDDDHEYGVALPAHIPSLADVGLRHVDPVIARPPAPVLPELPGVAGPVLGALAPGQQRHEAAADEPEQSATFIPGLGGGSSSSPSARRPQVREPHGVVDRVTSPAPQVRPIMVSATVHYGAHVAPLVFPRQALPYRFWVERSLANRHGLEAVTGAVRQWDGIPGSRWSTQFAGIVEERVSAAKADGRSVIFFQADCPAGVGGYAYWQTSTGSADARYGDAAVYLTEVDIGICPAVTNNDALRAVVAHEIGHAIGLEHLCDPGHSCWQEGMGHGPHGCRVMYVASSSCRRTIGEPERLAAIHGYPTIERLSGPSRVETAARASFAAFGPRTAQTVVLARADGAAHAPLAAAALSGVLKGSFLLGTPVAGGCLQGSAAEELARAAADPGRVILVGDWPQTCDALLSGWNVTVERVGATPDAMSASVEIAQRMAAGTSIDSVFVVSARADAAGHVPDGVAAGAAAGASGSPVLYTPPDRLGSPVAAWLRGRTAIRRAYVMGGQGAVSDRVAADLRSLGLEVVRVSGSTRVGTAVALASRTELFPTGRPVVLAASESWADAVTGSAAGARLRAPVLVTPRGGDSQVEQWLASRRPAGGYVVGGGAALPYDLQWRYSRHVR